MMFFYPLFISFFVTIAVMPALIRAAKRYRLFDPFKDDELKIHKTPISFLGGVGMFLGISVGLSVFAFLNQELAIPILGVLASILLIFTFGLWDDWKWKHITQRKPMHKLALVITVQLVAASVLLIVGIRPEFFIPFIPSLLVSFGALLIVSNVINLEDGMDGLAGLLVLISAVGFAFVFFWQGITLPLVLALSLVGATLAFLKFNFPPASIFMGDSGAYTLGSMLAILILFLPQA